VPAFVTADSDQLEEALRNKVIRPYSDFLLHDMGQLGDGIVQGMGTERLMRTPALWGLRARQALAHDGRFDSGEFADRVTGAIEAHGAFLSEAAFAAQNFAAISFTERQQLLAFLDSLGRAEFDHDGDNDVDQQDWILTRICLNGPQQSDYPPDEPCAISDFDQDGDVDLFDASVFQRAMTGSNDE
jgi:hypothetical protein